MRTSLFNTIFDMNDTGIILNGAILRLSSWCDDFPYLYPSKVPARICDGSNADMLSIIARKLNFSFLIQRETADLQWGAMINGSWTGMFAEIQSGSRDLLINGMQLAEDRATDFDFSYPYLPESYVFLAAVPEALSEYRRIFQPFDMVVWISMVLLIFGCLLISSLLGRFLANWKKAPAMIGYMVIGQSFPQRVKGMSVSAFVATILLCFTIVLMIYSRSLFSFLFIVDYPPRIETLDEFAKSNMRVARVSYGERIEYELVNSISPSVREAGKRLDLLGRENGWKNMIDMVMKRTHINIELERYTEYVRFLYNVTTQTYVMKDRVFPSYLSFYFSKEAKIRDPINSLMVRLNEAGIIWKLVDDHMRKLSHFQKRITKISTLTSLSIASLEGSFLVLVVGWMTSIIFFILENIKHRFEKHKI